MLDEHVHIFVFLAIEREPRIDPTRSGRIFIGYLHNNAVQKIAVYPQRGNYVVLCLSPNLVIHLSHFVGTDGFLNLFGDGDDLRLVFVIMTIEHKSSARACAR